MRAVGFGFWIAAVTVGTAAGAAAEPGLAERTWKVGDVERTALVHVPATKSEAKRPLVIAFHGHGGGSRHAARRFAFHERWPEAVCVYPQGLPTPVPVIDPNGRFSGWQKYVGDQDDRDLKFFDAVLTSLSAEANVDPRRIYVAGHSNGGFFAYVLAAARGEKLAAIAPVAANVSLRDVRDQKPLPILHVAGENDRIVRFASQERTLREVRRINGCDAEGRPAGEFCTEHRSPSGPPVVSFVHPGGHEIPEGAPSRIVAFFQSQTRKE